MSNCCAACCRGSRIEAMTAPGAAKIRVEPFTLLHQAGVIDVILPIQQGEFGVKISLDDQPDLLNIAAFYQRGCGNFWVALQGESVIGTIALLDIGDGLAALRKMFVRAEQRGAARGVAAQLLAALLQWAGNKGVRDIYLGTTAQFQAAHRFYEKQGFVVTPQEALPLSFPVMAVDSLFYRYNLR